MFSIAVQTGGLEEIYGIDGAYRAVQEAGFDAVDANVDHVFPPKNIKDHVIPEVLAPGASETGLAAYFRQYKDAARKYGLVNYQAHAPFPSCEKGDEDPVWNDFLLEMLKKVIKGCSEMECGQLIVHPFFGDYAHTVSREEEFKYNIERYMVLAETAKRYGVVINLENMFTGRKGKVYASICNEGQSAAHYVDTLNQLAGEKRFGFCLDVGHATLVGLDIKRFMEDLGDRITCFHVHDNDGINDLHQAPYTGKTDWDRFVEGLKEIRFDKTLSFETFAAVGTVHRELVPQTLRYIAACGRLFDRLASQ